MAEEKPHTKEDTDPITDDSVIDHPVRRAKLTEEPAKLTEEPTKGKILIPSKCFAISGRWTAMLAVSRVM